MLPMSLILSGHHHFITVGGCFSLVGTSQADSVITETNCTGSQSGFNKVIKPGDDNP